MASVPAGGATDVAGNSNIASTNTDNSVEFTTTVNTTTTVTTSGTPSTYRTSNSLMQGVNALALTVTGITANNKNTTATTPRLTTITGMFSAPRSSTPPLHTPVSGDDVSLASSYSAHFDNKNVG